VRGEQACQAHTPVPAGRQALITPHAPSPFCALGRRLGKSTQFRIENRSQRQSVLYSYEATIE